MHLLWSPGPRLALSPGPTWSDLSGTAPAPGSCAAAVGSTWLCRVTFVWVVPNSFIVPLSSEYGGAQFEDIMFELLRQKG